jgi:hypothetical protein
MALTATTGTPTFTAEDAISIMSGGFFGGTSSARKALLRDMDQVQERNLAEAKVQYTDNQQMMSRSVEIDSKTRDMARKNHGTASSTHASAAPTGQFRSFQLGAMPIRA